MESKFFWLKLKRDFFKRHDIRVVETMPNGKEYIIFYLKLLLESIDHNGELRFSETIPYNENMLSVVTDTNIDVVRSAMQIFTELGMIEILSNKTIYMTEVEKLIGSETKWAEQKRLQRSKTDNVRNLSAKCPLELDKELDKEQELVSKKVNNNSAYTCESYEEIIEDLEVSENVKPALWEFIKHCQLNKRTLTNAKLKSVIITLDMYYRGDIEKCNALKKAVNGGYYEIKK